MSAVTVQSIPDTHLYTITINGTVYIGAYKINNGQEKQP